MAKDSIWVYPDDPLFPVAHRLYPPPRCSSELPKGWLALVKELDESLAKIVPDYKLAQAKEKFGGLRYYIDMGNDEAFSLIERYEKLSTQTCMVCGAPGKPRSSHGWMSAECDKCWEEMNAEK